MRERMMNRTAIFGALTVFLITGSGLKYGIDYNAARELNALQEENRELLLNLDKIEKTLIWLGKEQRRNPYKGLTRIISTAYNSDIDQTDSTPFITASGERVGEGTLALSRDMIRAENAFMAKMGYNNAATISFGDTIDIVYVRRMVVHDTMNRRYRERADIWMDSKSDARLWGVRDIFIIPVGMNN